MLLCGVGSRGVMLMCRVLLVITALTLEHVDAVCTLCNTSLSFTPKKAGRASALKITFLLSATNDFQNGDSVTLKLPGFSRAGGSFGSDDGGDLVSPGSQFSLASWDESTTLLSLTQVTGSIPANTLISLDVKISANIALPVSGVVGDDPSFQIRTDTASQGTEFEPILSTEAVGVLYNTSLAFGADAPNEVTSVGVNFTFSANLRPGDTITLSLASFTIASSPTPFSSSATICSDPFLITKTCSTGTINGTASSTGSGVSISFDINDRVPELESVTLLVPSAAGITLPSAGTSQAEYLIQTDAVEGPVGDSGGLQIESSPLVPATALSYDPPQAGTGECITHDVADGRCLTWVDEGTDVTFTLTYSQALATNDTVILTLPGFTRSVYKQTLPSEPITQISCNPCDVSNFALSGHSAGVLQGAWSESTKKLTVTFNGAVPSETLISFTVPASVGLILPLATKNDVALQYAVEAAAGGADASAIAASPAIGAFIKTVGGDKYASTSLSLPAARVGVPGAITLVFTLTGALATAQCIAFCGTQAGEPIPASVVRDVAGPELVVLTLRGFSRAGGDVGLITTDSARFATASWDEAFSVLKLTSSAATPGGTQVEVTIPASAGIRAPTTGLELNTNTLSIATNAASGPVVDTAVAASPAVGFLSNTAFSVSPRKAGVAVQINVTATYSQRILAAESFTLALPGYTRSPSLPLALDVSAWAGGSELAIYATWDPAGPSISMVVGAGGINAGNELLVVLAESNGIVMREEGMAALVPRKLWRLRNTDPVPGGWLVAELVLFADQACTQRLLPQDPASANVASSGAGLASLEACRSFSFAAPSVGGCGSNGTRAATVTELAACKEVLCSVDLYPEYLAAQGGGAFFLGRGYGCSVGVGALPEFAAGADEICVAATLPAAHVSDNASQTFWWAGVDASNVTAAGEGYVGVEFSDAVAVACASVEQGLLSVGGASANYSAASAVLEASDDGVRWWGVLGGALGDGVSAIKAAVGVDSQAYAAPTLACDAVRGPVQATELASIPAIGSFSNSTSISFGNPVAGQASSILLSLVPQMEIAAGESLQLSLPGFSRDPAVAASSLNVTVTSYFPPADSLLVEDWELRESVPLSASWDEASATVTVVLRHTALANYSLSLAISQDSALLLPALGIAPSECGLGAEVQPGFRRLQNAFLNECASCVGCSGANENTFTLATNASAGPVLAEPGTVLRSVQRVGVISNASIEFSPLSPDFPVAITLNFTFNRPLTPGVLFFADLPDFRGAPNASALLSSSLFSAVSWDRGTGRATLTAFADVPAMTPISVTIPASVGIQLPSEGLTAGTALPKLSTDSALGAVRPVSIGTFPVVGAFTGDVTRLAYSPDEFETDGTALREGRIVSIAIGFSLNRRIAAGEYVAVYLIGFSRAGGDIANLIVTDHNVTNLDANFTTVDTNGVFSAFVTASWSEATSTLTLVASKNVAADQRHVVLVPASAGIRLPKLGLVENDPRILISTNARDGPNDGTPVGRSPSLKKVCASECSVWQFTCGDCGCGEC